MIYIIDIIYFIHFFKFYIASHIIKFKHFKFIIKLNIIINDIYIKNFIFLNHFNNVNKFKNIFNY